jgi:hypothetical protein
MKKLFILLLFVIMMTNVLAVQPQQSTTKLFLNPFYRATTSLNNNYNYSVVINPPDGISVVNSAIVSFDVYLSPSVTFNLTVNGQACNNPTFVVSTTFAGAGQARITFDCSNRIIGVGNYNLVLRVTQANTGAITGWLDLTYMNNPSGALSVMGTEYSPNDPATMFVQLKDAFGNPVPNGSCYLDIWYPLNSTGAHPYTVSDAPMIKAIGDDGIYYYDTVAPSILGVYMLSVRCGYSYNWQWIYPEFETTYYPVQEINSGTWQGGSQVLNSRSDFLYQRCDGSIALPCSANYTFNISQYGVVPNVSNINVYFSGESDTVNRLLTIAYWNGSQFINLSNTLNFAGTGATTPTGYDEFLTNSVPLSAVLNGTIKLRVITAGSVRVFHNWLSIALLSSAGTIHDLKGSSEMHITNLANATSSIIANTNNSAIAQAVWNYTSRNLTFYPVQVDLTNYSRVSNLTAGDVWSFSMRNLTYYQNFTQPQQDLTNYSLITNNVWSYAGNVSSNILGYFANELWSAPARYVHGVIYS